MPTVIFTDDGTEDGTFNNWSSNSGGTSSTTRAHGGTHSIQLGNGAFIQKVAVCADAGRRIRFYMYTGSASGFTNDLMCAVDTSGGATRVLRLDTTSGGLIQLKNEDGTQLGSTGTHAMTVNSWARIVLSYTITSVSVYSIRIYVDGSLDISATGGVAANLTRTGTDRFGLRGVAGGTEQYMDDVYIDDGTDLGDPDVAGTVIPVFMAQYRQRVS
jgi:hypothetical protein